MLIVPKMEVLLFLEIQRGLLITLFARDIMIILKMIADANYQYVAI